MRSLAPWQPSHHIGESSRDAARSTPPRYGMCTYPTYLMWEGRADGLGPVPMLMAHGPRPAQRTESVLVCSTLVAPPLTASAVAPRPLRSPPASG